MKNQINFWVKNNNIESILNCQEKIENFIEAVFEQNNIK